MTDKTKAEAGAMALEIELLARARRSFLNLRGDEIGFGGDWVFVTELERRLRVLLDLEEAKPSKWK